MPVSPRGRGAQARRPPDRGDQHDHDDRYVELSTGENPQVMTNRLHIDADDFGYLLVLEQGDGSALIVDPNSDNGSFYLKNVDDTGTRLSQVVFDAFNGMLGLSNDGYFFEMQSGGLATLDVDMVGIGLYPANKDSFRANTDLAFFRSDPQVEMVNKDMATGSAGRRFFIYHNPNGRLYFLIDDDDDGAGDSPHPMYIDSDGDIEVGRNFTVGGSKNARIPDPDDPGRAHQWGADESWHAGRLVCDYLLTITGGQASVALPPQLTSVGTGLAVRGPWPQGHPGSAYGGITDGVLTLTGDDGDYLVEAVAVRADAGVANWAHEVGVPADEGP